MHKMQQEPAQCERRRMVRSVCSKRLMICKQDIVQRSVMVPNVVEGHRAGKIVHQNGYHPELCGFPTLQKHRWCRRDWALVGACRIRQRVWAQDASQDDPASTLDAWQRNPDVTDCWHETALPMTIPAGRLAHLTAAVLATLLPLRLPTGTHISRGLQFILSARIDF